MPSYCFTDLPARTPLSQITFTKQTPPGREADVNPGFGAGDLTIHSFTSFTIHNFHNAFTGQEETFEGKEGSEKRNCSVEL